MKKIALPLLLITSVLVYSCNDDENSSSRSTAISVTVAEVETRNLSDSFSVSSEVVAYQRSYVASRVSGLVEEVHFEEGQTVSKGDILARIDVRSQQTQLRQARAALDEARDIRERNELLYEREAISLAELLTSRRDQERAEGEVERLELEIEFGTVRAPIDGVVTARLSEPGNSVSVNERMFTVTNMDLLVVRPGVSELNLAGLSEGQPVEIRLDAYPDRIIDGSIRRIFPSMDAVTRLFTVEVELDLNEETPEVRPGYLARVRFSADDRREVLTVPSEAVAERDGESVLFVLDENEERVRMIVVDIGIQRDGFAEVIEGIESGVKVAAANLDALDNGSEVQVVGTFRRYGFRN